MKPLVVIVMLVMLAMVGVSLGGCTKVGGDYVGKLTESSTITLAKDGHLVFAAPQNVVKLDTTFHVDQAGDKLKVIAKGCTIELTKKGKDFDVVPGQKCKLSMQGYEGSAAVTGTLTRDGRWLNAVMSLAPTEPGVDGSLVVLFSGTAK